MLWITRLGTQPGSTSHPRPTWRQPPHTAGIPDDSEVHSTHHTAHGHTAHPHPVPRQLAGHSYPGIAKDISSINTMGLGCWEHTATIHHHPQALSCSSNPPPSDESMMVHPGGHHPAQQQLHPHNNESSAPLASRWSAPTCPRPTSSASTQPLKGEGSPSRELAAALPALGPRSWVVTSSHPQRRRQPSQARHPNALIPAHATQQPQPRRQAPRPLPPPAAPHTCTLNLPTQRRPQPMAAVRASTHQAAQ